MHALVFAHEPLQAVFLAFHFVEADQVPVVPFRIRHGLVGIVESGLAELVSIPLQARHLAGFAANAGGSVNEFTDVVIARDIASRNRTRMRRNRFDLHGFAGHGGSFRLSLPSP